jgi:hypothetical protein
MLGYGHFTTPCPPSVSEHFVPRLFSEGLFTASRIVTEELTRFKRDNYRMAQNGKICDCPEIPTVNTMAYAFAIRTDSMRKVTLCVYMVRARVRVLELYLFNR